MSPPQIKATTFFGLRTNVRGNAHFVNDSVVVYPAGGVVIFHDFQQNHQRFIKLPDKHRIIDSICIAPSCNYIALNERADDNNPKPSISIYDTGSLRRKKGLTTPSDGNTSKTFVDVQFTCDSKYLVAVTGEPDWILYYYNWENGKVESQVKALNPNGTGSVSQVRCNPNDATLVVITGPYTFRLMNVQESVWRQWGWTKTENVNITTSAWLNPDRVIFGTKNGLLMFIENGELRTHWTCRAFEMDELHTRKLIEGDPELGMLLKIMTAKGVDKKGESPLHDGLMILKELRCLEKQRSYMFNSGEKWLCDALLYHCLKLRKPVKPEVKALSSQDGFTQEQIEEYEVRCLWVFSKGFAYSCKSGYVHMFEKDHPNYWKKRNVFRVNEPKFRVNDLKYIDLNAVQWLSISPSENKMVITTLKAQLYYTELFDKHMDKYPEIQFEELGQKLHHEKINSFTVCSWKPIFLTSGQFDRTVRVWNYETLEVELIKGYHEDIYTMALHPTGLFVAIGFLDKLKYMVILIDDLVQMRAFPIRQCTTCKFSNNGHLFAAGNGNVIHVFSSVSFSNIFKLRGHNEHVNALSWTALDDLLISCGADGAVYEWNMTTSDRTGEVFVKSSYFCDCAVSSDGKSIYVVGSEGELREIANNEVVRNLKTFPTTLDHMMLARSDMMIFITGGKGNLASIQFPLLDKAIMSEFHMHNAKITGIALSYDDQTLITVAEDATMCIWKVTNFIGKVVSMESDHEYCTQILIDKPNLMDKINTIRMLTTRIAELITENEYQTRQMKAEHDDYLMNIQTEYCNVIEELKEKNEQLEIDHHSEINMMNDEIEKIKDQHEQTMETVKTDFHGKLIIEYNKYQVLQDKKEMMRIDYEKQLEDLALSKRVALQEQSDMYEGQLTEKNNIINELNAKNELEFKEHEHIKNAIEIDADREIVELKIDYETQLNEEKSANVRLRGETGILKKKLITSQRAIEEFKHTVASMEAQHRQYQEIIQNLEKDIKDLRKDIKERDSTIELKEDLITEFKMKLQELEKYKFVLKFKINELKNQIEPKELEIGKKKSHITDVLEKSVEKLFKKKNSLEFKLSNMMEKLNGATVEIEQEQDKYTSLKNVLKKIQSDLFNLSFIIKDPAKLKDSVAMVLEQRYMKEVDFSKERSIEEELTLEFNRQRDHLERRIMALTDQIKGPANKTKVEMQKITQEKGVLIIEIENLQKELKLVKGQCAELKSRLSKPGNKSIKIHGKFAFTAPDLTSEEYNLMISERDALIQALREDNEELKMRVSCQI